MSRIAVVMGGTSHEAEISLRSGAAIAEALREAGCEVVEVKLKQDSIEMLPRDVEAVFIALHGGYGERGGIQADLDAIKMPYTGPGATASTLCMDKEATKQILRKAGIPVAEGCLVTMDAIHQCCPIALPVVVKPPRDGSSVGLSKVERPEDWAEAVRLACAQDEHGEALVETYIPGKEWGVSVINGQALPVIEIQTPNNWYDFQAKYTTRGSHHLFPESSPLTELVQALAVQAVEATGCRGAVRVDFRVTPEGKPFVLEINTVPGCTATSLLPEAARFAGISFSELCKDLIAQARYD